MIAGKKRKIVFVFGTRPEAIKLCPVIHEMNRHSDLFHVKVCVTAQHRGMLDQVLNFFEVAPDYDLNIMRPGQDLFDITIGTLEGLRNVLSDLQPDWIVVQGDTTTTFAASLSAFYLGVRVAHVEAGLRSFNKYSPFPEEVNRILTSHITSIHFAPTEKAKSNLIKEGIDDSVIKVVGNTVIDALLSGTEKVRSRTMDSFGKSFEGIHREDLDRKIVLVTGHRRESFGEPFRNICYAIKELARRGDVTVIYPVHLNPNVRTPVNDILKGIDAVHLIEPLDYPAFIWLMERSYLILTDSGGVQEEAPSIGKPVLVMRDVTERTEGIDAGTARLVGTDLNTIVREASILLDDLAEYRTMAERRNPYGDGNSSVRIREVLSKI